MHRLQGGPELSLIATHGARSQDGPSSSQFDGCQPSHVREQANELNAERGENERLWSQDADAGGTPGCVRRMHVEHIFVSVESAEYMWARRADSAPLQADSRKSDA